MKPINRRSLAFVVATLALAALAPSCSKSATPEEACDNYCACAVCTNGDGRQLCLDQLGLFEAAAAQKGCSDRYDAFVTCLADDPACGQNTILSPHCADVYGDLMQCTQ